MHGTITAGIAPYAQKKFKEFPAKYLFPGYAFFVQKRYITVLPIIRKFHPGIIPVSFMCYPGMNRCDGA
jgi:hypothetical protein